MNILTKIVVILAVGLLNFKLYTLIKTSLVMPGITHAGIVSVIVIGFMFLAITLDILFKLVRSVVK